MSNQTAINLDRLMETLKISAEIGTTAEGGLRRLALSKEDQQMRDIFVEWLKNEGLAVRIDDFGNIYGRREGTNPEAAPVMIGSHLDTQPNGGRYDGILGVLTALEVIRVLNEQQIETYRPIEIVNFTNEEGARFEPPMLGSGGIANKFTQEFIYNIKDKQGITFLESLQATGYQGEMENRPGQIHSYVELHIEQGPVLENEGLTIGAVRGIQGMTWLEVQVEGKADHAGTTPMSMRKDALLATAKMIIAVQQIAKDVDEQTNVTVGRLSLQPDSVNCIPGHVTFTVDVRHFNDAVRKNAVDLMCQKMVTLAATEGLEIRVKQIWEIEATNFSEYIVDLIGQTAKNNNYPVKRMISGAGHDAKYIADIAPTAMIFVPSVNGISHSPEEFTSPEDIEKGANVLLQVVSHLAQLNGDIIHSGV